jgi:hypothetical protein
VVDDEEEEEEEEDSDERRRRDVSPAAMAAPTARLPPPPPPPPPPPTQAEEEPPRALRLVGICAPGNEVHLIDGGDASGGGEEVGEAADVEWWRVRQGETGLGAVATGYRVHGATGGSYHCTSMDVGFAVRAVHTGREALSTGVVAPHRLMLTLLQHKLEEEQRHEFKLVEVPSRRPMVLLLTRKKIELLSDADEAAPPPRSSGRRLSRSGRDSSAGGKGSIVHSAPWASGVVLRFVPGTDAELTLQLAASAASKRRPPPYTLSAGTRQQRDLALLAVCAFWSPKWLAQAQAGEPSDVSFVIRPEGGLPMVSDGASESGSDASGSARPPTAAGGGLRRVGRRPSMVMRMLGSSKGRSSKRED